jgi:hypothetical protein
MADAADIIRWVGVAVAFIGAVVVSPEGTYLLLRRAAGGLRRYARWVRSQLARWLPWLRQNVTIAVASGSGTAHATAATLTAVGRGWVPGESVEEKLDRLRREIEQLHGLLNDLRARTEERLAAHDQAIAKVGTDLEAGLESLRALHEETHQRATETDARALPVVGVGIVLSGIPQEIAALPRWAWVAVLLAAVWLAVFVAVSAARDRRA